MSKGAAQPQKHVCAALRMARAKLHTVYDTIPPSIPPPAHSRNVVARFTASACSEWYKPSEIRTSRTKYSTPVRIPQRNFR